MAARIEVATGSAVPDLLDLRQIDAVDLEPLLAEETRLWREALEWDFSKSADLVRRFVDLHALHGCALADAGRVTGYGYYVYEDQKGLIGDLYVRAGVRTEATERRLLQALLEALIGARVRRIESQLMMAQYLRPSELPGAAFLTSFERNFMVLEMGGGPLAPGNLRRAVYIERWSEQFHEAGAQLIAAAYSGHVDSRINDQYRSVPGARRFLFNIVQYPGCGTFFKPASFAAFDAAGGRICGLCLASIVAPGCGHITQICLHPSARGAGLGYELLRHSLDALAAAGCRRATLTVTASNTGAVRLYESIGFRTTRRFWAYVWEGF